MREFFSDWENEDPAVLLIERVDLARPPAPLSVDQMSSRLGLLIEWLDSGSKCWDEFARGIMANPPGDIHPYLPSADSSGLGGQAYGHGTFQCGPEDAMIIEFDSPDCLVWQLALYDRFFQTVDFDCRQSSLNDHQGRMSDGRLIGVISHHDPGVANWLDPGGCTEGILASR